MNETSTMNNVSLTSRIQHDYMDALELSANTIGLDHHEIRYKGRNVNLLTLDECCEFLQSNARRSMLKILKGIDLDAFSSDEVKSYINSIRPEVEKYDPKQARTGFVIPEDPNASRINGKIILNEFYHSFNNSLCSSYDKFHSEK